MTNYRIARQRALTRALLEALEAHPSSLRLGHYGGWRVTGARGHILADSTANFALYFDARSSRSWRACQRMLRGVMRPMVQGCDFGSFLLDHLPSRAEAALIRAVLGIDRRGERRRASPPRARRARPFLGARRGRDGRFIRAGAEAPVRAEGRPTALMAALFGEIGPTPGRMSRRPAPAMKGALEIIDQGRAV